MNIVIAGGGTGGHLFPGIAVAREIEKRLGNVKICFVGTAERIEGRIVPKEGFDIRFIRSEGLVRKGLYGLLKAGLKIPLSLRDSRRILKDLRPALAFGVGGYSSGPLLLCAALMGIPTIIHEQNTVPGLTNRLLGRFVNAVAVTYHESMGYFPRNRTFLTGNPIREEILKGDREKGYRTFSLKKGLFTIFIFGGSSGAGSINKAVSESLEYLKDIKHMIQFLIQTGEKDFHFMKDTLLSRGFRGSVLTFTYDMADAYAVADLVVSRAGATTLAELTACGKAAILVPYPYAAGNHQEQNAKKLWDAGASQVILDKDLNGKSLSDRIRHIMANAEVKSEMEKTCRSLGGRDATKRVVELVHGLLKKQESAG
jgi:UDP-N-acetylglucosamine--N-acetylmuramyl-(pentapeptide) pyrophosphoryl-undecaprenol N-acetylglucosamine transferase